jgi:hypothetical protein
LGIDQVLIKITRIGDRFGDGRLGDLMEHHAPRRNLGLQFLHQVPGDRLAFTITVGGEQQFIGTYQCVLEGTDRCPLLGVDDVESLEAIVDIDAGPGPLLTLVFGGNLGGTSRKVANVTAAGLDNVAVAQKTRDLVRLGRGLDDDEPPAPSLPCHCYSLSLRSDHPHDRIGSTCTTQRIKLPGPQRAYSTARNQLRP